MSLETAEVRQLRPSAPTVISKDLCHWWSDLGLTLAAERLVQETILSSPRFGGYSICEAGDAQMKAIATVAFGLASVVSICTAGASIASYVVAEPEHVSPRKDPRPDLWTFEPTRVDQSNQHLERLAPVLSSYAKEELQRPSSPALASSIVDAPKTLVQFSESAGSSQHIDWCGSKYRSYDPATDTYRSFSGVRRVCISPVSQRVASEG